MGLRVEMVWCTRNTDGCVAKKVSGRLSSPNGQLDRAPQLRGLAGLEAVAPPNPLKIRQTFPKVVWFPPQTLLYLPIMGVA